MFKGWLTLWPYNRNGEHVLWTAMWHSGMTTYCWKQTYHSHMPAQMPEKDIKSTSTSRRNIGHLAYLNATIQQWKCSPNWNVWVFSKNKSTLHHHTLWKWKLFVFCMNTEVARIVLHILCTVFILMIWFFLLQVIRLPILSWHLLERKNTTHWVAPSRTPSLTSPNICRNRLQLSQEK